MGHREKEKPPGARRSSFLERSPLGFVLTDLRGMMSEPTLSAARMLRCNVGDLMGRSLSEFVLREERPAFQSAIKRLVRSCHPTTVVSPISRADGTIAVATWTLHVTTDYHDRPRELLWLIETIVDSSRRSLLIFLGVAHSPMTA
jgi:PAS domain-containing protein